MAERWFRIPGEAEGDRTLEEQILALRPALQECARKTVLDLGCAEGLIAIEFARAGAAAVLGMDNVAGHIEIARRLGRGLKIEFSTFDLNRARPNHASPFDIVLALGVLHKLTWPKAGLEYAARSARSLLLMRSGRGTHNGVIRGKHHGNTCDSRAILETEGFRLEKIVAGPAQRGEDVEYWRKKT